MSMENNEKKSNSVRKDISLCLFDLFVTNSYALAVQMPDGKYVTKYLPISAFLIEEMLNQRGSIGCYQQCYKSNMVKWICFDFDCADKENPNLDRLYKEIIMPLLTICKKYKIRYLTEFSGRRGIHVWIIFSHLIPKEKAFQILSHLKNELYHCIEDCEWVHLDCFPATDSSKGNVVGKQVKLPLSTHKSGKQSWFFQGTFCEPELFDYEVFLLNQYRIIKEYVVNEYEDVIKEIGISDNDYIVRLKYKKYQLIHGVEMSVYDAIKILSETKAYRLIFDRLMTGKSTRKDWAVVLGTFSPVDDGGTFLNELYSIFPNYDLKTTIQNISRYKDKYFPATFEYLYRLYDLDMEESINQCETGFEYLMKRNNLSYELTDDNPIRQHNESKIFTEDTVKKEKKYLLENDEVLNPTIWNKLQLFKNTDINDVDKQIEKILSSQLNADSFIPNAVVYDRFEDDEKIRKLVSLDAYDRVLTTQITLLLQSRIKKNWNSYSYNIAFCNRDEIFFNWYSSWAEYINKIKSFIEVPFMGQYEVFVIDLKSFYDHVDFLAVYKSFSDDLTAEECSLFRFLIDYNDMIMRKIRVNTRKGVPQGPAYARIISEMFLDRVLSTIVSEFDSSTYYFYRYVDDIIFFVKPNNNSFEMYNNVIDKLISYDLPVNQEKTMWYGKICGLNEEQKNKILRKDKFTYDIQYMDYKGFVTLVERKKDIDKYLSKNGFSVDKSGMFFSKRTYFEASNIFFERYVSTVMESKTGRGSSFKRFYEYMLTHIELANYALDHECFFKIPIDSINFGNLLGVIYLLVQEEKIDKNIFERIQKEYLSTIKVDILSYEYRVSIESLIKIKMRENDGNN